MPTSTRPRGGVGQRTAHDPGDPLVTSHCPFCGSGQVLGRSDGTIGCDFCGQNYIVRVQPAFPGMPQMPMGPGAPSDVGPDGGLLDPGMVGPDGMPADGEGPPPGDAAAEGGPEGSPPDGEELPPGDDGGDDDTPFPPKKDKNSGKGGNKKESARFRGFEGQSLTEGQLVRHLAVRLSGADPRVMARLRAEGDARRAAATEERLYRALPTGHRVSVGRLGNDWYGVIRHPASQQVHYMHLGQPGDVRGEVERQLGTGLARSFIDSTTPGHAGGQPGMPEQAPGQWWNSGQQRFQDTPFHSASRGRRPFEVRVSSKDGPGWWDELLPGDQITGAEQAGALRAMREHFRGLGYPVQDQDSNGYENLGPSFTIPDTGHHVSVGLSRRNLTWTAHVHHPGDMLPSREKTIATVNLGLNAGHVPHLLRQEMGSQPLIGEMRSQCERARRSPGYGDRPAGGWRGPDKRLIRPRSVRFTARGAQLPDGEDHDD